MLLSQALAAPTTMPSHCDGLYLQTVNQNKSFLSSLLFGHSRETMATQFSSYTVVCYLGLRSYIPFCFRVHMKGSKRGSREQEDSESSHRLLGLVLDVVPITNKSEVSVCVPFTHRKRGICKRMHTRKWGAWKATLEDCFLLQ